QIQEKILCQDRTLCRPKVIFVFFLLLFYKLVLDFGGRSRTIKNLTLGKEKIIISGNFVFVSEIHLQISPTTPKFADGIETVAEIPVVVFRVGRSSGGIDDIAVFVQGFRRAVPV